VPDRDGRLQILRIHTKDMPLAGDVNLEELADRTNGYTGADLEDLTRRAGMHALRENLEATTVEMRYFERALKEVRPSVTPEMEREYAQLAERLKRADAERPRIGFDRGERLAAD
jgi:transitional endoplasmic reticulum ATPase